MGKRVLLVDDNYGDRMVMRDCLFSLGYQIVGEAKDGQESVEKYKKLNPDLVVMDASIPNSDGISPVMKILRLDKDATIIMCTTNGQRRQAIEAMQIGARDFVTKPINLRALHRAIFSASRI